LSKTNNLVHVFTTYLTRITRKQQNNDQSFEFPPYLNEKLFFGVMKEVDTCRNFPTVVKFCEAGKARNRFVELCKAILDVKFFFVNTSFNQIDAFIELLFFMAQLGTIEIKNEQILSTKSSEDTFVGTEAFFEHCSLLFKIASLLGVFE